MRRWELPSATHRANPAPAVVTPLCVAAPALGLLAQRAPLIAAALTGFVGAAILGLAAPVTFVGLSGLLATAVPKAGVLIGGLPLPVMMFALLLAGLFLRSRAAPEAGHRPGGRLIGAALAWLVFRLLALFLHGGSPADLFALAGWFGLPMVLLLSGPRLGALRGPIGRMWTARLELGVMVACVFSVVQQVFGIERTAIPGLTRSVGADYSLKPLAFQGGTKIPSTYQNGNVLGVITAFFFLIAADRIVRGKGGRRDVAVVSLTAVATVLCGSRTILIGVALGLAVVVVRSGLRRQTIVVFALSAAALAGSLQLSPALAGRLTGTRAADPALALRSVIWDRVLETTSIVELATGGPSWAHPEAEPGLAEGLIGAIQQVGVLGMVFFLGAIYAATNAPHLRRWRLILIPVAVSFAVDSAYLVFPTLFVPLARMFTPLDDSPEAGPVQTSASEAQTEMASLVST